MRKHKFIVEIEIPEGANITDMKHYIHGAISTMCGSLNPIKELLFDLDRKAIKVTHATRAKAAKLLEELKLN